MSRKCLSPWLLVAGAVCLPLALWSSHAGSFARDAEDGAKIDLTRAKFYGAAACMRCHKQPSNDWPTDFVLLNEYTTWRTRDKHALAYAALEAPRGRRIGELLGIQVTEDGRCLNCHALNHPRRTGQDFNIRDGVSCDACHGPAEYWLKEHAFDYKDWRKKSPGQKEARGMFDVRDPVKRAELCASCHVGNAAEGKVVTHAMYAAGHPPLPGFQTAGFCNNLPPHWRGLKDVRYLQTAPPEVQKRYHFGDAAFEQTRLVRASEAVCLRTMARLLANRANFTALGPEKHAAGSWPPPWLWHQATNQPALRWPELGKDARDPSPKTLAGRWPEFALAQLDCYGCHHELKSPGWRQVRGYAGGSPGRPQFQPWPLALADLGIPHPAEAAGLKARQRLLVSAFAARPFGDPGRVVEAGTALEEWTRTLKPDAGRIDRPAARKILRRLCTLPEDYYPDYDSARQIAWAFLAVHSDLSGGKPADTKIEALLTELDNNLNLTLKAAVRGKAARERHALATAAFGRALSPKDFDRALADKAGFLEPLQRINDAELAGALKSLRRYDPRHFKRIMSGLADRLKD